MLASSAPMPRETQRRAGAVRRTTYAFQILQPVPLPPLLPADHARRTFNQAAKDTPKTKLSSFCANHRNRFRASLRTPNFEPGRTFFSPLLLLSPKAV